MLRRGRVANMWAVFSRCEIKAFVHMQRNILEGLPIRGIISYNAFIAKYAQEGHGQKALGYFQWVQSKGVSPDAIINACISQGMWGKGMLKRRHPAWEFLCQHVCKIRCAQEAFCPDCSLFCAFIMTYASKEQGKEAVGYFQRMRSEGMLPDAITYA
ncbi:hypothetical protein GOP47_0029633 [Adiantum capillus-veneris]|nr:hypothetical protein GOP47_0029633 [Adiantum capillus-veneris]